MWHLVVMNGLNNDLSESEGWCDLRMKRLMEWTFEGGPKLYFRRVGADGNRTRYQSGVYVCTWESGRFVNLSGTAIIRFLLPSQATDSLWRIFLYIKRICYMAPPVMQENLLMAGGYHSSWHIREKEESGEFFLTDSNKGLANIPETMAVKKPWTAK